MSKMICLAGMPGSGKTTWALAFLRRNPNYLYFSPDEYYGRINGDECDRSHTFEIWMAMFRDIHTAELAGRDVIIDSDNLTYAQRNQWIEWFPGFDAHILVFIEDDFNKCMERVNKRKRTVPEDIMHKKFTKWENPFKAGDDREWDVITQFFNEGDGKFSYAEL